MDAATELTGMYLQRVLQTHPRRPNSWNHKRNAVAVAVAVAVAANVKGRTPNTYRYNTAACVPRPGSLSSVTFHPNRSHNRRTIDSPSPVPCGRVGSAR